MENNASIQIGLDWWCCHNSLMTGVTSLAQFFQLAASAGCQGVGLDYFALPKAMRADPSPLLKIRRKYDMQVVFGFGVPLSSPEVAWQMITDDWERALLIAQQLGASVFTLHGGMSLALPGIPPIGLSLGRRRENKAIARRLQEIAPQIIDVGLQPALLNNGRMDADRLQELEADLAGIELKVGFNSGWAVMQGHDPYREAARLAPMAAYVMLRDVPKNNRGAAISPGEGEIELIEIMRLFARSEYQGLFSLEFALPPWKHRREQTMATAGLTRLQQLAQRLEKEIAS